jgi:hypothetical protein
MPHPLAPVRECKPTLAHFGPTGGSLAGHAAWVASSARGFSVQELVSGPSPRWESSISPTRALTTSRRRCTGDSPSASSLANLAAARRDARRHACGRGARVSQWIASRTLSDTTATVVARGRRELGLTWHQAGRAHAAALLSAAHEVGTAASESGVFVLEAELIALEAPGSGRPGYIAGDANTAHTRLGAGIALAARRLCAIRHARIGIRDSVELLRHRVDARLGVPRDATAGIPSGRRVVGARFALGRRRGPAAQAAAQQRKRRDARCAMTASSEQDRTHGRGTNRHTRRRT